MRIPGDVNYVHGNIGEAIVDSTVPLFVAVYKRYLIAANEYSFVRSERAVAV